MLGTATSRGLVQSRGFLEAHTILWFTQVVDVATLHKLYLIFPVKFRKGCVSLV